MCPPSISLCRDNPDVFAVVSSVVGMVVAYYPASVVLSVEHFFGQFKVMNNGQPNKKANKNIYIKYKDKLLKKMYLKTPKAYPMTSPYFGTIFAVSTAMSLPWHPRSESRLPMTGSFGGPGGKSLYSE